MKLHEFWNMSQQAWNDNSVHTFFKFSRLLMMFNPSHTKLTLTPLYPKGAGMALSVLEPRLHR